MPAPAGGQRPPRSRRVAGRAAATAAPQWPRPEPGQGGDSGEDEDSAGRASAGGQGPDADRRDGLVAAEETETPPAQVIPLPLFDARKEAEKWW
jgi:putative transposase